MSLPAQFLASPSTVPFTCTRSASSQPRWGDCRLLFGVPLRALQEQFPLVPGPLSQGSSERLPNPEDDPLSPHFPHQAGQPGLQGTRCPLGHRSRPREMQSGQPRPASPALCLRSLWPLVSHLTSLSLGIPIFQGTNGNS